MKIDAIKNNLKKLTKEKKPILILMAGLAGILMILFSELGGTEKAEVPDAQQALSDYEQELTDSLNELLTQIDGAGRTSVMLTLECGEEAVYARDTSQSADTQENKAQEENVLKSNTNLEYSYIIIKSNNSAQDGLLLMTLRPKVRGVAVVCDGGDKAIVRQQITESVSAALGIGASSVSVSKMSS